MNKRIAEQDHYLVQGTYISPIAREILNGEARRLRIPPTRLASNVLMEWAIKTGHNIMSELTKEISNEKEKINTRARRKKTKTN